MSGLMLDKQQMKVLNTTISKLEDMNGNDIYFIAPVMNDNCDKYDCFFASTKCTCQGICDGRD